MKTITFIIILSFTWLNIEALKIPIPEIERAYDVSQTIAEYKNAIAIIQVESIFNPDTLNVNENAAGLFQIRPIMLKEVNRILGKEVYSDSCRFNSRKSIEMYLIVQRHHNPTISPKLSAYLWNCGTVSPKRNRGNVYWKKVKEILNYNTML